MLTKPENIGDAVRIQLRSSPVVGAVDAVKDTMRMPSLCKGAVDAVKD